MSLADVDREAVLGAMAEYDALGSDEFLRIYGLRHLKRYVMLHAGREYASIALMDAAHQRVTGHALSSAEFNGGVHAVVARVAELEFDLRDLGASVKIASPITIGEIPGIPEGTTFVNRVEAAERKVHRAHIAGIVGNGREGAESVVSSGGYEDDKDDGSLIMYTGHGGRDGSGKQIKDQSFHSSGNAALRTSMINGTPVRVIRGADRKSPYAPDSGYRYDGLFRVEESVYERGQSNFQVCRFRMVKVTSEEVAAPDSHAIVERIEFDEPEGSDTPRRQAQTVQRIVRSTEVVRYVKRLHDHTCQICETRLSVGNQGYSEGAHIQGLGNPDRGPDIASNVLCLCANCHVLFDYGALVIKEDLSMTLNGEDAGQLRTHPSHALGSRYLAHHREAHE
jgi:putative restriction endonuclease